MGIYIHVPFCRSKCFYCGFYSVASLQLKEAYIRALGKEMQLRKDYPGQQVMSTLYLGGGTPSFLHESELDVIIHKVKETWKLADDAECSIEMNPEDVNPGKLAFFKELGFNRLTIGAQSFNDAVLKRINRTHSAAQIFRALEECEKAGFDNVGIDLILGLPGITTLELEKELSLIKSLNISHLSVYILSIDSNSVFKKLSEKGKFKAPDDDLLAEQYLMTSHYLEDIGFEHYEISNFAKDLKYSRHNTAYWQQKPYLGLGPGAHSFDRESRQWNVANLKTYIDSLDKGKLSFEKEVLTDKDRFNEYLMTNFRTIWGIDPAYLQENFGEWWQGKKNKVDLYRENGLLVQEGKRLRMSKQGWLVSDGIFSELFV